MKDLREKFEDMMHSDEAGWMDCKEWSLGEEQFDNIFNWFVSNMGTKEWK